MMNSAGMCRDQPAMAAGMCVCVFGSSVIIIASGIFTAGPSEANKQRQETLR